MKKLITLLFVIFVVWMVLGSYLISCKHPKGQIVMGLGVFYMAFILMPLFIYHRYKGGNYKKYQTTGDIFKPRKEQE